MHEDLSDWFWSRVARADGCWEWQRARDSKGYGQTHLRGFPRRKRFRAHRVAWELVNGPIPPGLLVLHRCDNRACVRPEHLFLGTDGDNIRDAMRKGRLHGIAIGVGASDNRGSRHGMAKLTEDDVRLMRQMLAEGATGQAMVRRFGVSPATVSVIRNRIRWRHI
jgi:hypothetical protein